MRERKIMKRNEIDNKYKWDLSDIYKNRKELDEDIKRLPELLKKIESFKGCILKTSKSLKELLDLTHEAECILERCEVYNYCLHDVELDNKDANEGLDLTSNMINEYNQTISFIIPEILLSKEDDVLSIIKEDKDLALLDRHFKEMFRVKKHILSENEEKILSTFEVLLDGYSKTQSYLTDKEIDYGEITVDGKCVKLVASNLKKYHLHKSRDVRRETYEKESAALMQFNDTLANNFISYVKTLESIAKLRHFDNYLEQVFYEADIDTKVYDTLKNSVKKHHGAYEKYVGIFKKCLDLDEIYTYDMNAPLFDKSTKEYTVEDAKAIILDTFKLYGDKYTEILKYAFDNGAIDYFPCENKSTGWSSIYSVATLPKVFANFDGKILDISALCHELGHFCNQYLSIKNNPFEYVYQSTFCAEVASLTNEIVFSHLYETDDKNTKAQLLFNFIKTFASNFFGAARQAIFEEEVHMRASRMEALSSSVLNEIWLSSADEVFGKALKGASSCQWSTIPHFFLNNGYYVYNYSTAIIAATNVASKILDGEEGFIDKYMGFLKLGSNMRPQDCLATLGIDMCDAKTYDVAINYFENAIDKLDEYIEKR